jgi:hypothetical protein
MEPPKAVVGRCEIAMTERTLGIHRRWAMIESPRRDDLVAFDQFHPPGSHLRLRCEHRRGFRLNRVAYRVCDVKSAIPEVNPWRRRGGFPPHCSFRVMIVYTARGREREPHNPYHLHKILYSVFTAHYHHRGKMSRTPCRRSPSSNAGQVPATDRIGLCARLPFPKGLFSPSARQSLESFLGVLWSRHPHVATITDHQPTSSPPPDAHGNATDRPLLAYHRSRQNQAGKEDYVGKERKRWRRDILLLYIPDAVR